jgi:hypothetical protein
LIPVCYVPVAVDATISYHCCGETGATSLIIAGERGATKLPHHHDESLAKQQAVCLKLEQIAQRAIH